MCHWSGQVLKNASKQNLNECEYHIQDNAGVHHSTVKIICDPNQFPTFSFFGPHTKPHLGLGLRNNYNLDLYPKPVQGVCVILWLSCA